MNTIGLLDCLELQIDIQELKKIGLSEEEIDGFIEFEWDPVMDTGLISSLLERRINDQH